MTLLHRGVLGTLVLALVATMLSWCCCVDDGPATKPGLDRSPTAITVVAAATKADSCSDDATPLAAAEPGRSPLARTAAAGPAGSAGTTVDGVAAAAVARTGPAPLQPDPGSGYAHCVLRT